MANSHRRRNTVNKIKINGEWLIEDSRIRQGIVEAFENLLSEPGDWRASLMNLSFSRIIEVETASLEEPFTEEEVKAALTELNGDKAPDPDGFTTAFWQHCWDIVKEVLLMFKDFHEKARFVPSLNSTFIVLVPKKGGVEDIKDFRPINLVNSLYKLIAKVLANRLKRVMSKLVNIAQNAFVAGRQILDASLIANEVIDSIAKKKDKGILYKLDIEKAYDTLNWNFLPSSLQKMGFGERWIEWIKWCITTVSFSVIVNGSPVGYFKSTRGLRQGDPLSPYLFVLGMEVFSILIDQTANGGFLSGFNLIGRTGEEVQVTHLLFADDTLVFCKDSREQLVYLNWILMWFKALFGLKINLSKSALLPVGSVVNLESLALELGCKVGCLPTTFLGLPLGAKHNSTRVWDGVEEKFIALWKRQYISKGGESHSSEAPSLTCQSTSCSFFACQRVSSRD